MAAEGSEVMQKYRILHSEDADEGANRILWTVFNPSPEHQILREWIGSFGSPYGDDSMMIPLMKELRDAEEKGTHPSKIPTVKGLSFMDRLIIEKRRAWGLLDDLSHTGSKTLPSGYGGKSISFGFSVADALLEPLISSGEAGGFLGIHGGPIMGKTGICISIGEIAINRFPGVEFLTNAPIPNPPPGMVYMDTFEEVLSHMADALDAERRWFWNVEESSLAGLVRARGASGFVQDFQRFVRIIPKLGGGLLIDEHREEDVPSVLSTFIRSKITCIRPGFVIADLPSWKGAIEHVPRPKTKYESGSPAPLYIPDDFAWDGLFRALRYDPSSLQFEETTREQQAKRLRAFLESLKPVSSEGRPSVTCRFCRHEWVPQTAGTPLRCPHCRKSWPTAPPPETEPSPPDVTQALEENATP